jgi:predicted enzyme related to lactoylglutathione lyase
MSAAAILIGVLDSDGKLTIDKPQAILAVWVARMMGGPFDQSLANLPSKATMSQTHGKFVWYDVMTSDTKTAESFYRSVIGWDAKDSGMTDRSYTILSMGPTMVGGLMPIPEDAARAGVRPASMGYVGRAAPSIAALKIFRASAVSPSQAIRMGRTMQVPGGSWIVQCRDPQGVMFAMMGPKR